jgi:predicted MPP superfamily phosphohydrolase
MSFILRIALALLIIILIQFYFSKKITDSIIFLFPKTSPKKIKKVIRLILVIINIYPVYLLFLWAYSTITQQGRPQLPENFFFDYLIMYPFWISAFIILQSIIYLLFADLIKLLVLPVYKKYKEKIKPVETRIILGIIVFFIIYVPARIIYDYNSVSVRIVEYTKENLPDQLNDFNLVFISDIQADRYTDNKRLDRFITRVNSLNPDLVLIAGDLVTSTPDYIDLSASYIGKIKSKYKVYSCVGDHDNWAYRGFSERSINEITAALKKYGAEMINNGNRKINVKGAEIGITFVTNTYVEFINEEMLNNLTNGEKHSDLNIFLTHQPRYNLIENAYNNNYDLMLAGHTHGGQITFLFPFIYLSPTLFETKYVRGDFYFDDMLLVVTRGLGMSLVPIRYNSTPEIVLIKLKKK